MIYLAVPDKINQAKAYLVYFPKTVLKLLFIVFLFCYFFTDICCNNF